MLKRYLVLGLLICLKKIINTLSTLGRFMALSRKSSFSKKFIIAKSSTKKLIYPTSPNDLMGRTKSRNNTKITVCCDEKLHPVKLNLNQGNRSDSKIGEEISNKVKCSEFVAIKAANQMPYIQNP
jgi:hypothetical protein